MKKIDYGLVGNGLLATHLRHFFDLEKIPYRTWSREEDRNPPTDKLEQCSVILLAISDNALEQFIQDNPPFKKKKTVHFSGALSIAGTYGFHPLMTFSKDLYTLDQYRKIPFIGENGSEDLQTLFPHLNNPYYSIERELKPLYHALCVLGGNFTTILWQKVIKDFESQLSLPKEILDPYIEQIHQNIQNDYKHALTGPIKREDRETIKKNITALKSKPWQRLYRLFNKAYKWERNNEHK